uniref:Uncharacterized protein n=1 Tax=Oryza meridionalis TaxID=40149 RepID=A0A0E0D7W8_9ORYZ
MAAARAGGVATRERRPVQASLVCTARAALDHAVACGGAPGASRLLVSNLTTQPQRHRGRGI